MGSKVAWSRQEAAILLDGYIDALKGEFPRMHIVKRVSADLRKMAVNNGMQIDDIFRNENGISSQMRSMSSAYCGRTIKTPATQLFTEVVALYNESHREYEKLLEDAKRMIDEKFNYKDAFSLWLTEALPTEPTEALLASCDTIEQFCQKFKVLKTPLFETTDLDILNSVNRTVARNKIFRIINKKRLKLIDTAMVCLLQYVEEGNLNKCTTDLAKDCFKTELNVVDFNNIVDYAYTKPTNLSYFGEPIVGFSSWTGLYVEFFSNLYSDYPHLFKQEMSFTNNGSNRIDLCHEDLCNTMAAPKPVSSTPYFLETNLSAKSIVGKIKFLLDLCRVDYENVVIKYQNKSDDVIAPNDSIIQKNAAEGSGEFYKQGFFKFLRNHEAMAESTCQGYVSAINTSECFAKEHHFESHRIFTSNLIESKETVDALFRDSIFINYNDQQHNRFRAAINKWLLFLQTDAMVSGEFGAISVANSTSQLVADEKYREVLTQNFRKGFRMSSPIELRKFKRCYEQMYGKMLEDDDDTIKRNIGFYGIIFEDKAFIPQTMLEDDIRERLFSYIKNSFDEGKTALYYQALFNKFSEEFLDYYIYNTDMLKAYLSYMLGDDYFFSRSYLSKAANTTVDSVDEIRTCLKEYAAPMKYDVMFENLPHISQQKIKQILASNAEFVNNGRGEYFHVSVVHFSDEEIDNIAEIISAAIDEKEFLSGNELIDDIKSKYPYICEKNDAFSMVGLRDTIKYHLCQLFSFSGNIISKSGSCLTMSDVFADYCNSRETFTIDELQVLAGELGTIIYFEPVYENSLRINHECFVSKMRAQFLVSDTDAALDRFCTGDYISIGKVTAYSLFPNAGFPWNEYLLEHYVAIYSEKYHLLHIGFNSNKCVGIIVKKSAGLESFDDCIVDILAKSDIPLNKQTALQYMCDEGYIGRRMYTNIEELLIKATAQRNRKEAN